MKIAIVGTGYVGLVTGACFADVGHTVCCIDNDAEKVAALNKGKIPIYEPGLEDLVKTNLERGMLTVTTEPKQAIEDAEIIFIAVGTPPDEDGSADLQYVLAVAKTIGTLMNEPKIIVNKSTVPVGTADLVRDVVADRLTHRGVDLEFHVCSNPEFLKEGNAVEDFQKPDRIILGTDSDHVCERMRECYAPFNRNHDRLMVMDVRSSELTKYAANAMLATKISFINEIANIAERVGADIEKVRVGIGSDPRIGYHFIYPGAGYGGSCFPKDVQALARTARESGVEPTLLDAVERVNERQKTTLFTKLSAAFDGNLDGKHIAIWGLAFKPKTDDMRAAPSRILIEALLDVNAQILAFDPEAAKEAERLYGGKANFELSSSAEAAAANADALVICTEWPEFRVVDFEGLKAVMKHPLIIDGRNILDPALARKSGFAYLSVGRP